MGSVEGDVGGVNLKVFIWVSFTSVTFRCERFLLSREGVLAMKSMKR